MSEAASIVEPVLHGAHERDEVARLGKRAGDFAAAGRHREAVSVWEELSLRLPEHEGVMVGLGAALVAAGRYRAAVTRLSRACLRYPKNAILLRLEAHALLKLGDSAEAAGALYMALELDPEDIETHSDLGSALHQQGRLAAALPHAAYAHCMAPSTSHAAILVDILLDQRRGLEALAIIDAAIEAKVEVPSMLTLRSFCLRALGDNEQSLAAARRAFELLPTDGNARTGLAMALLVRGQFTPEAWELYDSRAGVLGITAWPSPERRWRGEPIAGQTIMIHAEQGFGDTLNFIRYVPMVAALGAKVVLVVQPGLCRLLQHTPGADRVLAGGSTLPEFDRYTPLLSLPGLFGTTIETVPPPLPLLVPRRSSSAIPKDGNLQVGLVWAGNRAFVDNGKRSVSPAMFQRFGAVRGVTFHNLQFGAQDLPIAGMNDPMPGVVDFADTAAIAAELDLIISVDTSVAHLAAALGKPVWMLSRFHGCWRWLIEGETTPWYPTMRIYRQQHLNAWEDVMERVATDLQALVASRARPAFAGLSAGNAKRGAPSALTVQAGG